MRWLARLGVFSTHLTEKRGNTDGEVAPNSSTETMEVQTEDLYDFSLAQPCVSSIGLLVRMYAQLEPQQRYHVARAVVGGTHEHKSKVCSETWTRNGQKTRRKGQRARVEVGGGVMGQKVGAGASRSHGIFTC